MKTFLFYDLETTGLNKSFDQVLQFAAIRTDTELNEIERHEIWVKLTPDVIPHPSALLTHRIPIQQMRNQGLPEIEAIRKIHQLLNAPQTLSIGYNTLNFDDEFLRFSFFRNLLPPYTHQYANQCSRADMYPIIICYYLYKNSILKWPHLENKISFKLENLNSHNQLTPGQAHHALFDVEATIALAKACQQEQETWQYLLQFFDKTIVNTRITKLPTYLTLKEKNFPLALIIDPSFGFSHNYQCPALLLGSHYHYKNKLVWLRLDKNLLTEQSYSYFSKPGENSIILPFNSDYSKLTAEQQHYYEANQAYLLQHPEQIELLKDQHCHYLYPKVPELDPAAALYDIGFFSDYENLLCQEFHQTEPTHQHLIIEKFTNPILQELAIRMIGRNYSGHLPEKYQARYQQYLKSCAYSKLYNYRGEEKLTIAAALLEIEKLKAEILESEKIAALKEFEKYLHSLDADNIN